MTEKLSTKVRKRTYWRHHYNGGPMHTVSAFSPLFSNNSRQGDAGWCDRCNKPVERQREYGTPVQKAGAWVDRRATRASAEAALKGDPTPFKGKRSGTSSKGGATEERPDETALSVDGACSGNPGPMEYRAVWVGSKEEAFKVGPMLGTNNLGEFLALVDALRLLHERGDSETAIYTDSLTARAWVRNKRANSTLPRNARTAEVWRRIDEATAWLKAHPVRSPIRTWDTRGWGEIPADFGRK